MAWLFGITVLLSIVFVPRRRAILLGLLALGVVWLLIDVWRYRRDLGERPQRTAATDTAGGEATPTFTPQPTPFCGTDAGHPLLCRGGAYQGRSCTADADCGLPTPNETPPVCSRHGHDPKCLEQSQCGMDGRYRTPVPLGGSAGDTVADAVVGNCSTEDNTGDLSGEPADVWRDCSLAFDTTHRVLYGASGRAAVVQGWAYPSFLTTNAPSTLWVGQTDPYNRRWQRLPGDLTKTQVPPQPYALAQTTLSIAVGPAGELWVTDFSKAARFPWPVTTGESADAFVCATNCSPSAVAVDGHGDVAVSDVNTVRIWRAAHLANRDPDYVFGTSVPANRPECNDGGRPVSAATLCNVRGLAFTADDHLVVADTGNNRGLVFDVPARWANDMRASTVLCQPDFATNSAGVAQNKCSHPSGVACLGADCALTDNENRRVLGFTSVVNTTDGNASTVYGQPNFTSNAFEGYTAQSVYLPRAVALSGGSAAQLFVLDHPHERVLRFDWPTTWPASGSQPTALSVLGQPDFTTWSHAKKVTRRGPSHDSWGGIAFTSRGGVYVSITAEHRVGYWAAKADAWHGKAMTLILGQDDGPDSFDPNRGLGAASATTLNSPTLLSTDPADRLYIADTNNNRVLRLDDPPRSQTANQVYGHALFTTTAAGVSDHELNRPYGVRAASDGSLWIADTENHRVVRISNPLASTTFDLVLGQANMNVRSDVGCQTPSATTLCRPMDVLVDVAGGRVFVADTTGLSSRLARVLIYRLKGMRNGAAATGAIGAATLSSWSSCKSGELPANDPAARVNICGARGLALSAHGNVYVSEADCSGVGEFDAPFSTSMNMARAFGTSDPTSWNACDVGYTASQWDVTGGVSFDPATGDMWSMDAGSEGARVVVVFDPESGRSPGRRIPAAPRKAHAVARATPR